MWEKYLKKIPEMVKQIKAIWALPGGDLGT